MKVFLTVIVALLLTVPAWAEDQYEVYIEGDLIVGTSGVSLPASATVSPVEFLELYFQGDPIRFKFGGGYLERNNGGKIDGDVTPKVWVNRKTAKTMTFIRDSAGASGATIYYVGWYDPTKTP